MKSLGADRNQQGRLSKVLIWGAVRAHGKRVPWGSRHALCSYFSLPLGLHTRWYYICMHLALWHVKHGCWQIASKAVYFKKEGASLRGGELIRKASWHTAPCNKIVSFSTPVATVKFKPGRSQGLSVAVGSEKLAKCILKLSVAAHPATVFLALWGEWTRTMVGSALHDPGLLEWRSKYKTAMLLWVSHCLLVCTRNQM